MSSVSFSMLAWFTQTWTNEVMEVRMDHLFGQDLRKQPHKDMGVIQGGESNQQRVIVKHMRGIRYLLSNPHQSFIGDL